MPGLSAERLVLDRSAYALLRPSAKQRILPVRQQRRVQVGRRLSLEFENEETLQYQVQEMIYAENITDEHAAAHEVASYQRLVPTANTLTATMFLEFTDVASVQQDMARVSGIEKLITLTVGRSDIVAEDVPPPDEGLSEQTFSVHFLRFSLTDEQRRNFADDSLPVSVHVAHPNYQAATELSTSTRAQLLADLGLRPAS